MAGVKGKSGRKPKALSLAFRDFCREIINDEEVLKSISERARIDPMFALKVAEFGIGRPFQAVHVQAQVDTTVNHVREVILDDGKPAFAPTEVVPEYGPN